MKPTIMLQFSARDSATSGKSRNAATPRSRGLGDHALMCQPTNFDRRKTASERLNYENV